MEQKASRAYLACGCEPVEGRAEPHAESHDESRASSTTPPAAQPEPADLASAPPRDDQDSEQHGDEASALIKIEDVLPGETDSGPNEVSSEEYQEARATEDACAHDPVTPDTAYDIHEASTASISSLTMDNTSTGSSQCSPSSRSAAARARRPRRPRRSARRSRSNYTTASDPLTWHFKREILNVLAETKVDYHYRTPPIGVLAFAKALEAYLQYGGEKDEVVTALLALLDAAKNVPNAEEYNVTSLTFPIFLKEVDRMSVELNDTRNVACMTERDYSSDEDSDTEEPEDASDVEGDVDDDSSDSDYEEDQSDSALSTDDSFRHINLDKVD